jgi:hypothetical protein
LTTVVGNEAKAAQVQAAARFYLENLAREDAVTEAQEQLAKGLRALPSVSATEDEAAESQTPVEETARD